MACDAQASNGQSAGESKRHTVSVLGGAPDVFTSARTSVASYDFVRLAFVVGSLIHAMNLVRFTL
jgi:hypothetical protein